MPTWFARSVTALLLALVTLTGPVFAGRWEFVHFEREGIREWKTCVGSLLQGSSQWQTPDVGEPGYLFEWGDFQGYDAFTSCIQVADTNGAGTNAYAKERGNIRAVYQWKRAGAGDTAPPPPVLYAVVKSVAATRPSFAAGSGDISQDVISSSVSVPDADSYSQEKYGVHYTGATRMVQVSVDTSQAEPLVELPAVQLDASIEVSLGPNGMDCGMEAVVVYGVRLVAPHAHPTNYRQDGPAIDLGDGSLRFYYRWDSTSGRKAPDGIGNVDLNHIYVGEYVKYPGDDDPYVAPDPPFDDWRFNNPTVSPPISDRNGNAGIIEDTQRGDGNFRHPHSPGPFSFIAEQKYRFYCDICDKYEDLISQIFIVRRVECLDIDYENGAWEYSTHKSGAVARRSIHWLYP